MGFWAARMKRYLPALLIPLLLACQPKTTVPPIPEGFVNKVWRVSQSSAVAPGTLYVFLEEGTLVVASRNGKPALGTWKMEKGGLVMVEESIPYQTEILSLTAEAFRIRSRNPGQPVEITLVPAAPPLK
jgi:hypothetical protein